MNHKVSVPIIIGWQVGVPSGWGTYGLNLALQLCEKGVEVGLPFLANTINVTAGQQSSIQTALDGHARYARLGKDDLNKRLSSTFLRALGDGLDFLPFLDDWSGKPDIGVVFFESAEFPAENLERAAKLDAVITGSSWNAEILEQAGLRNVFNCPQGIEPTLFHPGPRSRKYGDRYTIFSGGKLEYRKGQDLVVAAFRRFYEKHPEALLVTAWHNPWPEAANSLSASTHIENVPGTGGDGALDISGWLQSEGLPPESFVDLGAMANGETPDVLRDMDAAIFPNRCEGGTNLVAMEAMACGVPSRIQTSKTEKSKKTGKTGAFAAHLRHVDAQTGEEVGATDQVSSVAGVGGILAAQAVDPAAGQGPDYQERKRRARRGEDILERLDEVRKGLLVGSVPKDRLGELARLVREKREKGADPLISQLLDEIELRAEVELAKLSRR